ncbi:hypothetical protein LTR56_015552 [Elasticomyces elasticus]|nr:hypothetical protein LTR56_015552 [Elasticomyces elasticus]KAK3648299.1 hypothetical protein LTR22_013430 [Elasticomyces elasticus]KAK4916289.1 hypothetical protein LTR49_015661 [Elasticomyces elasticus]KAK5764951.1 hypothetical protein LTS12_004979 [Elasticomyces elasticus]
MASTGSLYSSTLEEITNTKLSELAKRRATFEQHRERILTVAQDDGDLNGSLVTIADIVKTCFGIRTTDDQIVRTSTENARLEIDLANLNRFLAQAKYDPTVSKKALQQWRKKLLRHVEIQSLKFTYASLYGQLTTEWLTAKTPPREPVKDEDAEMEDYEHVSGAKRLEARAKWEHSVFTATKVDATAIETMLRGLFESTTDESTALPKAIEALRADVKRFEGEILTSHEFTNHTLRWAIDGLLASDLLTNEKREALRDFRTNDVILREVADVLNMRLSALSEWTWGKEVLVEERRQLNGTYNIYLHEDLLQALFLQHVGVKWSVFFKKAFRTHRRTKDVWKELGSKLTSSEKQRRRYFLGAATKGPSVVSMKQKLFRQEYFVSQLQSSEYQETHGEEGAEEADFEEAAMAMAPQQPATQQGATQQLGQATQIQRARMSQKARMAAAPRRQMASQAARRSAPSREYEECEEDAEDEDYEDSDSDDDDAARPRNPMAAKQGLLHLLSTDILVQTRLRGEIACFRSQIDNLCPRLPHDTVKTVLRYFGVSETWLDFFIRFLEAPLRFMDDDSAEPRKRKTGTPGAHVLSEVFAETTLFCCDFLVNQKTDGEILFRLHDDLWFWGSYDKCATAWSTVNNFVKTTGLQTNDARTGSVRIRKDADSETGMASTAGGGDLPQGQIRWGMLFLNAESGRFEIDQGMVDTHISELKRQLANKGNSTFAWIQVFNSYAATFFTTNFGKPANCFGRQHVDNMLATHNRIQKLVFTGVAEGGSFVDHLKSVIADRQGVTDIPDGYFYFPTDLGGLEIQSPFITLLQVRDAVLADSNTLFKEFESAELEAYRGAKRTFEDGEPLKKRRRTVDSAYQPEDPDTFMTLEEYTKYREELNYGYTNQLADIYAKLLEKPSQQGVETENHGEIQTALRGQQSSKLCDWYSMEPYWKYVAQLYGPEMLQRFGSFKIVDAGLLPMGMVALFRSGRVQWQE